MPAIDFSEVKGLEPLPVAEYAATITKATEGLSKSNNPKIDLEWTIVGGKFDGKKVFDSLVFTPQTMFRVKNSLVGLGFPKNFKGNVGAGDLVGKNGLILLEIDQSTQVDPETNEPYPPRNRVKKIKALPGAEKSSKK